MATSQIHHANADWWDETAGWYGERDVDDDIEFLRAGGTYLLDSEREMLGDLSTWCGRAIHLQCSHGRDGLSLLHQGAAEVVGVDISERLVAVARRKSEALGANSSWICSDVLSTPRDLDGTADLVYTGKGAICWMMDIAAWAAVVARLLKPGGRFFIHESHPLDWVWDVDAPNYTLDPEFGDYYSQKLRNRLFLNVTETVPQYRTWTLAEIVNGLIDSGLAIDRLMEYPEPFWGQFPNMTPDTLRRLPHSFALLATKR